MMISSAPIQPVIITGARLVDPASHYDGPGSVRIEDGCFTGVEFQADPGPMSPDARHIDGTGLVLCPGLVDIRVKTGEPGSEPRETLKSASLAAAAGGVTSMVLQSDTSPAVDDPSVVDFLLRRSRDIGLVHVFAAGAATKGLQGELMAEIGLMRDAGCVYISDAGHSIVNSQVFRRVLAYATAFDMPVAHRPADPWLTAGSCATDSDFAARLGLPSAPAVAEQIMLERDLALAELTGAQLIVDQITTAGSLEALLRARQRGVRATSTTSINHLIFNEIDIGDYRTFARLDPPLRGESDRQALIDAVAGVGIDIIVSAHDPAPAEDKRLPFSEAAPGSIGLETLLLGLIKLHKDADIPLLSLLAKVTSAPADLLGLDAGGITVGAPADLVLFNLDKPRILDADKLRSKSRNSIFDGRRLEGEIQLTLVGGRTVFKAGD
jgi:dihydroorotase